MSAVTGISGIQLSAASAAYAPTNSADVSAIASAYATGKQDALTFGYDAESAISSINGSGLAGGGVTGDYVEKDALEVAIGYQNTASSYSIAQGSGNSAASMGCAFGNDNKASNRGFAQGYSNSAINNSLAQGYQNRASGNSFACGTRSTATASSFAWGAYVTSVNHNIVFGQYNLRGDGNTATGNSAAFAIGDGTAFEARHDLMLVTKDGEITMYSSTADTVGTGIMSSIRALSANAGGVDSATVSAIASSYAESAASSKLDESATADFYSTSNPSGFITGVDLSDYATTAYVDSAVSGKLDTTAFNSGDFYTTANPSGFIDSAYVDSAVSGKADSSSLSSYVSYSSLEYNTASAISGINGSALAAGSTYSAGEGIDITDDVISVEAPVDIVAGPGIVIDNPDGNTLRVSTDENYETVLWSGTLNTLNSNIECSENLSNFSTVKIFYRLVADSIVQSVGVHEFEPSEMSSGQNVSFGGFYLISNNFYGWWIGRLVVTDGYKVKITNTKNSWGTGSSPSDGTTNYSTVGFIYKIVGVHRIANN